MSCTQFHCIKMFILRHAWLNLWNKHMTTGRINQVTFVWLQWSWCWGQLPATITQWELCTNTKQSRRVLNYIQEVWINLLLAESFRSEWVLRKRLLPISIKTNKTLETNNSRCGFFVLSLSDSTKPSVELNYKLEAHLNNESNCYIQLKQACQQKQLTQKRTTEPTVEAS
jgi:hypothetical protein